MTNNFRGEIWKKVTINRTLNDNSRLEVSNYGRVRTFNNLSQGKIVKGSLINGYPIIRLKLFIPRNKQIEKELLQLREQISNLQNNIRSSTEKNIEDAASLEALKKILKEKTAADIKQRTVNFQSLVHRLVAEYFLRPPAPDQTVVAHIDYEKLNNDFRNLKWMTAVENQLHQKSSPYVIGAKNNRYYNGSPLQKLTVTRVMLLKKLLHENKPIKNLAKQFKVTETQILRIQRGENWGSIAAAT